LYLKQDDERDEKTGQTTLQEGETLPVPIDDVD
jgi:hypothetical protein